MKNRVTEEQVVYAKILDLGMKVGLIAIIVTFGVYVLGVFEPLIPLSEVPKTWGMPVKEYLKTHNIHAGWSWVGMIGKGDFLNFVGIAFLAGITIICYLPVIPIFLRKNDRIYAAISVLEVLVLVLAASGILKGGH